MSEATCLPLNNKRFNREALNMAERPRPSNGTGLGATAVVPAQASFCCDIRQQVHVELQFYLSLVTETS